MEIIHLDIGGTHPMSVARSTLCADKDSFLTKLFSSGDELKPMKVKDDEGKERIFIDRPGHSLYQVINFLQTSKLTLPEFESIPERKAFFDELAFWHIETHFKFDAI